MRSESPDLHPAFINSLRSFFAMFETRKTGVINYATLCQRIREVPSPNLPPTFLSCVGKVANSNGDLTFEKFLTAVKLALRESDLNNNQPTLHRVQSEGRLHHMQSATAVPRKLSAGSGPTMGVNGFDRRPISHYSSQPNIQQMPLYADRPAPPRYGHLYANLPVPVHYEPPPQVILRPKKISVRNQKEENRMRHPQPPSMVQTRVVRSRPQSNASYNSLASSALDNVLWRNSSMSSGSDSQRSAKSDDRRHTVIEDELAPRMAKLGGLHREEEDLMRKALETCQKLESWYRERLDNLQKKKRLLSQGVVALDSAVHEQKMNFLRAHISELNRRISALMETSDRGFPSHHNMQKSNLPQAEDDHLTWLHRQNRMLSQELSDKTQIVEDLKREKENNEKSRPVTRIQPSRPISVHGNPVVRPAAMVRPAVVQVPMSRVVASPVKVYDTLM